MEKQAIDHVIAYVGGTTTDWVIIKLQLVKTFPPFSRNRFSLRHQGSMKFFINDFEQAVIAYWKEKTGFEPRLEDSRFHPKDWPNNPRGWGLIKFNNERRKAKTASLGPIVR